MYEFFWNGPFSSWCPSPIVIRGYQFNCCEQYFMAAKASVFLDRKTAEKICSTADPRRQKALGREIVNFNPSVWNAVCRDIMFRAHWAKFTQNADMRKLLMATIAPLVEASPYDKIWGIGLESHDPRAKDPATWQGTNWLGEILTEIRDGLLSCCMI